MRKRFVFLFAPLVLGGGLLGAGLLRAGDDLPKDWKLHESKEGRFTVALPGTPLESRQLVKTGLGTLEVTMLLLELRKENAAFVVSFSDFPEAVFKGGDDATRLDYARTGAVTSAKGKLVSEKRITLGRHAGRELLIENAKKEFIRTRLFAVDKRLYQTIASGPKAFVQSKEATVFLDSFKLTK